MHDRVVVADFYLLPNHADGNARGEGTMGIRQYERWKRRLGYGQGDTVDADDCAFEAARFHMNRDALNCGLCPAES